jgi:hypothetical protein
MKYIFFPGNSARNKEWIDSLASQFSNSPKEIIHYSHWYNEEESIDFEIELDKVEKLNIKDDCIAVSKSAGCYLSYLSQKRNILNIQRYIFIGFPYSWLEMKGFNPVEVLKKTGENLLIIQKGKDPAMSFDKLKNIIEENGISAEMIEYKRGGEPIDNHSYEDLEYLKETIDSFVNLS